MLPREFPIGTIWEGDNGLRLLRINDKKVVYVSSSLQGIIHNAFGNWQQNYREITLDDLEEDQKKIYYKWFTKEFCTPKIAGCTCDLQTVIMIHGCQCGWVEKERAK